MHFEFGLAREGGIVLQIMGSGAEPSEWRGDVGEQEAPITIGRKATNRVSFEQDCHMSNLHAQIFRVEHEYFIEDLESTNGTWLRLSRECARSKPFLLREGMHIKFGTSLNFIVSEHLQFEGKEAEPSRAPSETCVICFGSDKDALYIPCKHNAACVKCSKSVSECPVCRVKIKDIIRIYRV